MSLAKIIDDMESERKTAETHLDNLTTSLTTIQEYSSVLLDAINKQVKNTFDISKRLNIGNERFIKFLEEWFERPYRLRRYTTINGREEIELSVPHIVPIPFGILTDRDGVYNIYTINRFSTLLHDVPMGITTELGMDPEFTDITVEDGMLKVGKNDLRNTDSIRAKYNDYLLPLSPKKGVMVIKEGSEFDLICSIIRDGVLPFAPKSVEKEDMIDREPNFPKLSPDLEQFRTKHHQLLDMQYEDYKKFLKYGAVGLFYPSGGGKSFFAIQALCNLKGPKLYLTSSASITAEFTERLKKYTNLKVIEPNDIPNLTDPMNDDYVVVCVYNKNYINKLKKIGWTLIIYDEVHKIAATTYLPLGVLNTKYRISMTATPDREDGRVDIIWAFAGMPLGVNWSPFIHMGLVVPPKISVYVEKNDRNKLLRLNNVIENDRKNKIPKQKVVFVERVITGQALAKKYKVPFIYGKTPKRDRLAIVRNNEMVIAGRVLDEGVSDTGIQMTIELEFHGKSKRQEKQRATRPAHTKGIKGNHVIIMTIDEYAKIGERIIALEEKGWDTSTTIGTGITDDEFKRARAEMIRRYRETMKKYTREKAGNEPPYTKKHISGSVKKSTKHKKPKKIFRASRLSEYDINEFPIIDARKIKKNELSMEDLIISLLDSNLCDKLNGFYVVEIREILHKRHIPHNRKTIENTIYQMWESEKINGHRESPKKTRYFLWSLSDHDKRRHKESK